MVVLFALFAGIAYAVSHDRMVRRALRNAPRFKIGDLPENHLGRIVGQAQPIDGQVLQAPLTGRPCLVFKVTVEEKREHWDTWIVEQHGVPFVLVDDTGRALVDPSAAKVSLEVDSQTQSGTFDDPTPIERVFLERHQQTGVAWVFNRTLRYNEAIVAVGERVAVLGSGTREPDPDAPPTSAYRGAQPTRLRLTSSVKYPLVISDAAETME